MDNKKFRFLALDLDGTLLGHNKKISKETILALDSYAEKYPDSVNAIITGRYPYSAKRYANFINEKSKLFKIHYVGASNGSFFYEIDLNSNSYNLLSENLIPQQQALKIYEFCLKNNVLFWGYPRNLHKGAPIVLSSHFSSFLIHLVRPKDTHIINKFLNENYSKINIVCTSAKKLDVLFENLKEIYPNIFEISRTSKNMLEITAFNINKGKIVDLICDSNNISYDQRVAIGDSHNDKNMFKKVAVKLAPINVRNALKSEADYIGTKHFKKRISCLFYDYLLK
ncbi:HAD-IIB family hydrolase [Mycoplasmoides pirum]|uniref:HAD-IIB family hydrolase n=1 Tax=Mycoplasmoides pirum TaxID=2122 RepID=UPI0004821772|nr:HAD family hydrolase [Mycoplasmoides pirum]